MRAAVLPMAKVALLPCNQFQAVLKYVNAFSLHNFYKNISFSGNYESQGYYDRCYTQFPSTIPTVHAIQFR